MRYRRLLLPVGFALAAAACQDVPGTAPEAIRSDPRGSPDVTVPPQRPYGFEGYMTPGEAVRTGFIVAPDGTPVEITYEVHGGRGIWEGDIHLGPADQIPTTAAELEARMGPRGQPDGPQRGLALDVPIFFRWPAGIVPYVLHESLTPTNRITVEGAIEVLEWTTAGVDFVPRASQENYVRFVRAASVCSSPFGMIGGRQDIEVLDTCPYVSVIHEMFHALGFGHEQSRCDRDAYVFINWGNITPGRASQFEQRCEGWFDFGEYDESSIMHYGPFAFALLPDVPTILSLRGKEDLMGQRDGPSRSDTRMINHLYGAFNNPPTAVIAPLSQGGYPEGTPVPFDASGSSDPDDARLSYAWDFGDPDDTCAFIATRPASCFHATSSQSYPDDGTYRPCVTVADGPPELLDISGFREGRACATVTVLNVEPAVSAGFVDHIIPEGGVYDDGARFTDPGHGDNPWTWTVDYGDGSDLRTVIRDLPISSQGSTLDHDHTYVDNRPGDAPYTVTVTVVDKDGGEGSDQATVRVFNVAPTVDAGPAEVTVTSGEVFSFSGSFSDPGLLDAPWEWEIDWDDGDASTGTRFGQAEPIAENRLMCVPDDYLVRLTVTDKDGGSGSDLVQLTVPYLLVDVVIQPGGESSPVNLRRGGVLPVAILSTPTFTATDLDPASVVIGDGEGEETPVAQLINGTHRGMTEDVNGDGLVDLVLMFDVRELVTNGDLTESSTTLGLSGIVDDGCTHVRGEGTVVVRP